MRYIVNPLASMLGEKYVVVECCNDQQALKIIHRRINGQISGLNTSADKVQGRISVLARRAWPGWRQSPRR